MVSGIVLLVFFFGVIGLAAGIVALVVYLNNKE
jgi:hypothetical protein